jgi:hypothetical protein
VILKLKSGVIAVIPKLKKDLNSKFTIAFAGDRVESGRDREDQKC